MQKPSENPKHRDFPRCVVPETSEKGRACFSAASFLCRELMLLLIVFSFFSSAPNECLVVSQF